MLDLSPRELSILVPLVVLTIFYGIHPGPILDGTAASVAQLLHQTNLAAIHTAALH
jgi:NADH-quinone oxidoreductase subunit M